MSTTVDSRIVQMKFDNSQFEKNCKTSMSTLDKLKEKLKFSKSADSLKEIDRAASGIKFEGISGAITTVSQKFSALEVIAIGALTRIGSQAVMAGEQLIRSMSVDQITAGWGKYEEKTSNVQTLMNSTGKSIEEVNEYLEDLMWYSDETSFGFTDMTSALSTMVASGGDIDKLIPMIQGMGNAVAYAGKGAAEFSRVIYNLNQSYSQGALVTMDWRSVQNAGAASKQLQMYLIEAAEQVGTIKKGTGDIANFADYLRYKNITSEAMEIAFTRFAEYTLAIKEAVNSGLYDNATDAIKAMGEEGFDTVAVSAFKSAQQAKSFSEAIDATKDAVSSGWMSTFEIIFGDYRQATDLWTGVCERLWNVFASSFEDRNNVLENAFQASPVDNIIGALDNAGISADAFYKKLGEIWYSFDSVGFSQAMRTFGNVENAFKKGAINISVLKKTMDEMANTTISDIGKIKKAELDYTDIVKQVIRGNYGNGAARHKALKEAGWDDMKVQDKVNKVVWKQAVEMIEVTEEVVEATEVEKEAVRKLAEELGVAESEISQYIDVYGEMDFDENGDPITGRTYAVKALYNIFDALIGVIDSVKTAWRNVFPASTSVKIFKILRSFEKFTEQLEITDERSEKITTIFTALFSVLGIGTDIIGAVIRGIRIFADGLSGAGDKVLDLVANFAKYVTNLRESIRENEKLNKITNVVKKVLEGITKVLKSLWNKTKEFIDAFKESETYQRFTTWLSETLLGALTKVKDAFGLAGDESKGFFDKFSSAIDRIDVTNFTKNLDKVTDTFTGLFDSRSLKTKFSAFTWNIKDVGEDFVGSFEEKDISKNIQNVGDMISELAGKMKLTSTSAKDASEEIQEVSEASREASTEVSTTSDMLRTAMENLSGDASDSIKNFVSGVADYIDQSEEMPEKTKANAESVDALDDSFIALNTDLDDTQTVVERSSGDIDDLGESAETATSGVKVLTEKIGDYLKENHELVKDVTMTGAALGTFAFTLSSVKRLRTAFLSFGKIGEQIGGFFKAARFTMESIQANLKTKMLLRIAASIGILSFALSQLANYTEPDKLRNAAQSLSILIGALSAMVLIMEIGGKISPFSMKAVGTMMIEASAAIVLMSIALGVMSKIVSEYSAQEIATAGGIIIGMIAVLTLTSKLLNTTGNGLNPVNALGIVGMCLSLLLIVKTLKLVCKDMPYVKKSLPDMIPLIGILVGLAFVLRVAGSKALLAGLGMFVFTTTLLSIVGVLKLICLMGLNDIFRNMKVLYELMGILLAISITMRIAGGGAKGMGAAMLGITLLIFVMTKCIKALGEMDGKDLAQATIAMGAMVAMVAGLILSLSKIKIDKSSAKTFNSVTLFIVAITASLYLLTKIGDTSKLIGAAISMGIVMAALAIALKAMTVESSLFKSSNKEGLFKGTKSRDSSKTRKAIVSAVLLTVAVAAALGYLVNVSGNNTSRLVDAALAMGIIMVAIGVSLKMMNNINDTKAISTKRVLSILGMVGIMFIIGEVLYTLMAELTILDRVDPVNFTAMIAGMCVCLLAIAATANVLAMVDGRKLTDKKMLAFAEVALAFVIIGGFLAGIMAMVSDLNIQPSQITAVCLGLSAAVLAMSGAVAILSMVKADATIQQKALALSVASLALLPIAAALSLLTNYGNFDNMLPAVLSLSALILVLTGVIAVFSVLPGGILSAAVEGALGISAFILIIGTLLTAIGGLNELTKGSLASFIEQTIPMLEDMGTAIGGFFGSMIGTFNEKIGDSLVKLAEDLSKFMINLGPFIIGAKLIDGAMLEAVTALVACIVLLTGASLLSGIADFFSILTGKSSLGKFGSDLAEFGTGISEFANNTKDINNIENVKKAAEAGEMLAKMASNLPKEDGLWQKLVGQSDLKSFAEGIGEFGNSLKSSLLKLRDFKESDLDIIDIVCKAGTKLADFAKTIPNEGGKLAELLGDNTLGGFAAHFEPFASHLIATKDLLAESGFDKNSVKLIENASDAGTKLAEFAKIIPNQGGKLAELLGDNTLGGFAFHFVPFAMNIASAAKTLSEQGFNEDSVEIISNAAKAGTALAEFADGIPNEGGMIAKLVGDNSLSLFGAECNKFSQDLAEINTNASELGYVNFSRMITISNELLGMYTAFKDVTKKDNLTKLGNDFLGFSSTLLQSSKNLESVNIDAIERSASVITQLAEAVSNGVGNSDMGRIPKLLKDIAKNGVKDFNDEFTNSESDVTEAINKFVSYAQTEMDSGMTTFTETFKDAIDDCILHMSSVNVTSSAFNGGKAFATSASNGLNYVVNESPTTKFYHIAELAVEGFCNGLSNDSAKNKAKNAGQTLGNASKGGLATSLDENSPSKEFYKMGAYAVEGYVNAVTALAPKAALATEEMGDGSLNSFQRTIDSISDVVDGDMEINPVITPVLDLSNIQNGVNSINRMFTDNKIAAAAERNAQYQAIASLNSVTLDNAQQIVAAINGSSNNTNVNVVLQGDAAGVFKLVRTENSSFKRRTGTSAFV